MKINFYWTLSLVFNGDIPTSVLTLTLDFFQFFEIASTWQTNSAAHKLKLRLLWQVYIIKLLAWIFTYSIHFQANSVDFHLLVWTVPNDYQVNSARSLLSIISMISSLILLSNQLLLIYNVLSHSIKVFDHLAQSFYSYVSNILSNIPLDWYRLFRY